MPFVDAEYEYGFKLREMQRRRYRASRTLGTPDTMQPIFPLLNGDSLLGGSWTTRHEEQDESHG